MSHKIISYSADKDSYIANSFEKTTTELGEYFEKQYQTFGGGDINNLYLWFADKNNYPEKTLAEISKGTTLQSILNEHAIYTYGSGLQSEDAQVKSILTERNLKNQAINDTLVRACQILPKLGNAFVKVVTDINNSFIHFYYIDAHKCRLTKTDKVEVNSDWLNYNKKNSKTIPLFPKFAKAKGETLESILHIKLDAEGYEYYGKVEQMDFALELNEKQYRRHNWQKNQLKKGFKKDFVLLTQSLQSEESMRQHEENIKRFSGDDNSGGIIPTQYLGDVTNPLIPITNDYKFDYANDDTADALFELFGFPRSLIGIKSGAAFSVEQIESDYEQYMPKVESTQSVITTAINSVFRQLKNTDNAVYISNMPPSIIIQNYFQYMEQPQINQVVDKYLQKYGIEIDFSQTNQTTEGANNG